MFVCSGFLVYVFVVCGGDRVRFCMFFVRRWRGGGSRFLVVKLDLCVCIRFSCRSIRYCRIFGF